MSWPLASLGDHVEILSGFAFKSECFNTEGQGLPLVRIRDVVSGNSQTYYSGEYSNDYLLQDGDMLVGMDGDFNRERWNGGIALLNQRVCKITAKADTLDQSYLYHFLPKALAKLHSETPAVTVKHLSVKGIRNIEFPLPPLTEQKRIAAILDKADGIYQKRKQAIKLADDFLRATFLEMFGDPVMNPKGWKTNKIKNGVLDIIPGWSITGENKPCKSDEFGVLKISSVTSGEFKPEENKVVDSETIPASKKLIIPKKDDLLFSRANTRELVAAICMIHQDYDNIFLPDKLWSIKLNHDLLLPEFFLILIQNEKVRELLTKQATGTSGSMLNISKNKFEETEIIYPDLDVQKKFCFFFNKTIHWKNKIIKSNKLAEESFKSLSKKVF